MREWRAEFWHSFAGHQEQSLVRHHMRLRALGAFADAWTLLQLDYGVRRRMRDVIESRLAPIVVMIVVLISMALATGGFREARTILFHDEQNAVVLVAQPNPFMGGNSLIPSAEAEAWAQRSRATIDLGRWLVQEERTSGHHERVLKADANAIDLFSEAEIRPRFDRIEPMGVEAPAFVGVVARLRKGATAQAAEELAQVARLHKGWQRPAVIPIYEIRRAPLVPIGSVLLAWMLLSALPLRHFRMPAWPWALAEIGLCFSIIAVCWIELIARAPITETAGAPAGWDWALYALPACAGLVASWWFRWEARRRCRTCYRVWRTPASIGLPGRCLLDPSGHGYLCNEGHGAILEIPLLGAFWEGTYS
ncbi:MAG TPA: hypothetical protein VJO16_19040 [Candidatus Acidoferrum sp.]|nr:hypothetical protein [Candidatus Acidoferrum sp.]